MCDETSIVERKDGMYHHRYLAVAAAGASVESINLTAAALRAAYSGVNTPFDPLGSSTLRLRCWMAAATGQTINNETCGITIVGAPRPVTGEVSQPKGRTLLIASLTAGTSSGAGVHPVTGATVAGITFNEVDTITVTKAYTRYSVLDGTDDGSGGQNAEAVLEFDPCNLLIFVKFTAISATFDDVTTPRLDLSLER